MLNNKKAWHICELGGKRPDNYSKYAFPYEVCANVLESSKYAFPYEVCANVLESSKYGDEFVGISSSSKYSKHFKGLQDMR